MCKVQKGSFRGASHTCPDLSASQQTTVANPGRFSLGRSVYLARIPPTIPHSMPEHSPSTVVHRAHARQEPPEEQTDFNDPSQGAGKVFRKNRCAIAYSGRVPQFCYTPWLKLWMILELSPLPKYQLAFPLAELRSFE